MKEIQCSLIYHKMANGELETLVIIRDLDFKFQKALQKCWTFFYKIKIIFILNNTLYM